MGINIKHLILILLLCTINQNAFGDVYQCNKDWEAQHQAWPCVRLQGDGSKLKPHNKSKSDKKKISVNFDSVPALTMLQLIADVSGHKLIYDTSLGRIEREEAFHYKNIPWDVLLNIVAERNSLDINIKNKTIYARKYRDNDHVKVIYRQGKIVKE